MTTATLESNRADNLSVSTRVLKAIRTVWQSAKRGNPKRESVRCLRAMTDYQLKDLGIHRSEITSLVYGRDAERVRYHEV